MPQGAELSACCCCRGLAGPWPQCQKLPGEGTREPDPLLCPRPWQRAPALQREASSCSCSAKYLRQQLGCGVPTAPSHAAYPLLLRPGNFCNCILIILLSPTPPPPRLHLVTCRAREACALLGSAPSPARQTAAAAGTRRARLCWGLSPSPSVRAVSPRPCHEATQYRGSRSPPPAA